MKKNLVLYYSKTGNNEFLARQIAEKIDGDLEKVSPLLDVIPTVMIDSLIGLPLVKSIKAPLEQYKTITIVGPVWAGMVITPLRKAIKRAAKAGKEIHFATCCGSKDSEKDDKFGYTAVFSKVQSIAGKTVHCEAFPIRLVISEDLQDDDDVVMKTRLNRDNFSGEIAERLNKFTATFA